MNRNGWRRSLRGAVPVCAAVLAWGCVGLGELGDSGRPNVVLILTDDQRWDQLGIEGHPFLDTPHLDRLAREGARFANMFVTTSLCSPSRAFFLSGLYASTHGVMSNFTDYPADLPGFPRRLQEAGYHTAYIGKWHMGEEDSKRPIRRGRASTTGSAIEVRAIISTTSSPSTGSGRRFPGTRRRWSPRWPGNGSWAITTTDPFF